MKVQKRYFRLITYCTDCIGWSPMQVVDHTGWSLVWLLSDKSNKVAWWEVSYWRLTSEHSKSTFVLYLDVGPHWLLTYTHRCISLSTVTSYPFCTTDSHLIPILHHRQPPHTHFASPTWYSSRTHVYRYPRIRARGVADQRKLLNKDSQ